MFFQHPGCFQRRSGIADHPQHISPGCQFADGFHCIRQDIFQAGIAPHLVNFDCIFSNKLNRLIGEEKLGPQIRLSEFQQGFLAPFAITGFTFLDFLNEDSGVSILAKKIHQPPDGRVVTLIFGDIGA